MAEDFGLPGQVVKNAASFWKRRIHPDDARMFLDSNQEIADGRADHCIPGEGSRRHMEASFMQRADVQRWKWPPGAVCRGDPQSG